MIGKSKEIYSKVEIIYVQNNYIDQYCQSLIETAHFQGLTIL